MDTLLFLGMFACLALVAGWYVGNEIAKASGGWGILSIRKPTGDADTPQGPRYRANDRTLPRRNSAPAVSQEVPSAPGSDHLRFREKAPRGRFRDKDETGFRSRGPLPGFGDDPKRN